MTTVTMPMSGVAPGKIRVPRLPAGLVARDRLLERLAVPGVRAVLVSAPAGFGKTVVVLDWLRREGAPVAWLSLDPLDNEPSRFCAHLAASLEGLDGAEARGPGKTAAKRAAEQIRRMADAPAGSLPPELLEALAEVGDGAVLVLDDVHEISAPPVTALLQALVEEVEEGPRLVLVTRHDPPIPLGRLRVAGQLVELRESDLRFNGSEAETLFETLLPGVVDRETAGQLERRTEGWVAGLRMAAIALDTAEDPRAMAEAFTGSHRYVVDYLLEEAVGHQPETIQRFLMETSILPRFTAEACQAVTQDPGARGLLEQVERANLFLVALGEDRQWFRYHHLFAELLRFRLMRLRPGALDSLHERASRWFEASGDLHQAIEHAAAVSHPKRLVEMLDVHGFSILSRSELASLGRWLQNVRDPLDWPLPGFLLLLGWFRVLTERAPDLDPLLATTAAALEATQGEDLARTGPDHRIGVQILRAFAARFAGRLDDSLQIGEGALAEAAPDDADSRGKLLYNQARVHSTLGDMGLAAELLERSLEENLRSGTFYLVLTGLGQLGWVLAEREGVSGALDSLMSTVAFAESRDLARLPAFSTVLYQLGRVHLLADDLDAAEEALDRAAALATAGGMPEGRVHALVTLARVRAAQRRFKEARTVLSEADAVARGHNAVLWDTTMDLERARLAFFRHVAGEGPAIAPPGAPAPAEDWTVVVEARAQLHLQHALRNPGEGPGAADLAHRLWAESEPRGRGVATTVALVARAALAEDGRWDHLSQGLEMASLRGYVRPLLDLGEPFRELLRASLSRRLSPPARAHALLLLDRFDTWDSLAAEGRAHPATTGSMSLPGLPEPLTDRELNVLEHLCRGGSNKAIARSLHVSAETVKTHLAHIYGKLGASGRREAVARARELGLVRPE